MLRDARVDDRMAFHTFIKELIYIYCCFVDTQGSTQGRNTWSEEY